MSFLARSREAAFGAEMSSAEIVSPNKNGLDLKIQMPGSAPITDRDRYRDVAVDPNDPFADIQPDEGQRRGFDPFASEVNAVTPSSRMVKALMGSEWARRWLGGSVKLATGSDDFLRELLRGSAMRARRLGVDIPAAACWVLSVPGAFAMFCRHLTRALSELLSREQGRAAALVDVSAMQSLSEMVKHDFSDSAAVGGGEELVALISQTLIRLEGYYDYPKRLVSSVLGAYRAAVVSAVEKIEARDDDLAHEVSAFYRGVFSALVAMANAGPRASSEAFFTLKRVVEMDRDLEGRQRPFSTSLDFFWAPSEPTSGAPLRRRSDRGPADRSEKKSDKQTERSSEAPSPAGAVWSANIGGMLLRDAQRPDKLYRPGRIPPGIYSIVLVRSSGQKVAVKQQFTIEEGVRYQIRMVREGGRPRFVIDREDLYGQLDGRPAVQPRRRR